MTTAADDVFAHERRRLLGLAYRILGSFGDAEDVVQEAWLRWSATDQTAVERPAAFLTTVVTRLSLDRFRAIERRREQYLGPWLPEPVSLQHGPEEHVEMAESLTLGFLMLLDRLNATERAVWLLADVFGEPYAVIAEAVDKTEAACRQIASRARRRLREERPPPGGQLEAPLLARLLAAVATGDVGQTLELLDADVVLVSDGGPGRHAARRPVVGARRVARFVTNIAGRYPDAELELTEINGSAALVLRAGGMPIVLTGEQQGGRVTRIYVMLNPDKLRGLSDGPALMD
ncbi:MAG: RNA polymerase sigma factor SigJ [Acidimicrobiales bacterium]